MNSNVGTANLNTSIDDSIFSQTITEEGFTEIDEKDEEEEEPEEVKDEARETGMGE